mgnify:CR=1 FL=1
MRIKDGFELREICGEHVILSHGMDNIDFSKIISLNETAAFLWKEAVGKENNRRPMKLDNVYIVKNVEIPLTIVECGVLSNEEEEKKLQEDEYQNRLAWGIYNGINDYFYEL